jgi:nitroreductase
MFTNIIESEYPLNSLIVNRFSTRAYLDKEVNKKDILTVLEAARWSPSCFNDQPWRFLCWNKFENKVEFDKAFSILGAWNQKWAKNIPVLFATIALENFQSNGKPNRWSQYDLGSATQNLLLQAVDLGLQAHPMGGYDEDKLKETFGIPSNLRVLSMITLGYMGDLEDVDEEYRADLKATRKRHPLGEIAYNSNWGNPIV